MKILTPQLMDPKQGGSGGMQDFFQEKTRWLLAGQGWVKYTRSNQIQVGESGVCPHT